MAASIPLEVEGDLPAMDVMSPLSQVAQSLKPWGKG